MQTIENEVLDGCFYFDPSNRNATLRWHGYIAHCDSVAFVKLLYDNGMVRTFTI